VILQGVAEELDPAVARAAYPTRSRQLRLVAWAYDVLTPTLTAPDYAVELGAVEREFDAAAAVDRDAVMPDSWTTIRLIPARMDFWQAGTETTPPGKTRFVLENVAWRHFAVLP
jgi:pyridoxamine 5'-phosphate oxidase